MWRKRWMQLPEFAEQLLHGRRIDRQFGDAAGELAQITDKGYLRHAVLLKRTSA